MNDSPRIANTAGLLLLFYSGMTVIIALALILTEAVFYSQSVMQ